MKIHQLVSNLHKTSDVSNQAIYSHVAWLTNGLVERGHKVNLFASGDSETDGQLFSVTPIATSKMEINENLKKNFVHLLISKCYTQASQADIIHAHFSLLNLFYSGMVKTPTVQSIHSPLTENQKIILKNFKTQKFVSFSLAQRKQMPELNWIANIYHGIDTKIFAFNPDPQDYFLYLGRITEEKGVHMAIEAAKATNIPLIIVGRSYPTEGYWHSQIEPHIDGKMIRYVGEANFEKKIEWLKNAKALLFPTQYEEIFGLAMIEAMSCGTPVIGRNMGSVSEIIQDKKTGYVVEDVPEMIKAIKNIDKIKREDCRKRAEVFFSVEKMVTGYINIYERIIKEQKFRENKNPHNDLFKILAKYLKLKK
jgi:glycosyltransferase involved in cell wall biosynthesis